MVIIVILVISKNKYPGTLHILPNLNPSNNSVNMKIEKMKQLGLRMLRGRTHGHIACEC